MTSMTKGLGTGWLWMMAAAWALATGCSGDAVAQDPDDGTCVGSNCAGPVDCPEGSCSLGCDGPTCDLSCDGGGCSVTCSGDSCNVDCAGGGCDVTCNATDCATTCSGDGCNVTCNGADACTIDTCSTRCVLSCNGAADCDNACGMADACVTND